MCGIFGIYSSNSRLDIINNTVEGLKKLQHRGKDGSGICFVKPDNNFKIYKDIGLVENVFKTFNTQINTHLCIGHIRYSTSGNSSNNVVNKLDTSELQPLSGININNKNIGIVHNGNIPNLDTHDTKFLLDKLLTTNISIEECLIEIMNTIKVSYCLLVMVDNILYIIRDRCGIRPLYYGFKNELVYVSSETCSLNGCINIREVNSGEILRIDNFGIHSVYKHPESINALCAFELIYFMNPNSIYNKMKVSQIREQLGFSLAQKEDIIINRNNYIVVGVPNSGICAAQAYAKFLNIEYKQIINTFNSKNGVDRTFILINDEERQKACKKKFIFDRSSIKNKNIIIVDDTIVRGNVMKSIISNIKISGANEIHIRIPAPPVVDICQLGIAILNKNELLMNNTTINNVEKIFAVNSLKYLDLDDLSFFPKDSYKECFGKPFNFI